MVFDSEMVDYMVVCLYVYVCVRVRVRMWRIHFSQERCIAVVYWLSE